MKRLRGAVAGVMVLAVSGAAFAQGLGGSSDSTVNSSPSAMSATDVFGDHKASELNGMAVHNHQNEKLGTISDLIIDKDGKVSNVVLHEGGVVGIGGKSYLVPWDRIQVNKGEKLVFIDVNKDQLSSEFAAMEEKKDVDDKEKETGKPSGTSPPTK